MTLVLYFGHEKPWSGPLSLKERLNVPKEFEPYVNDYKINLFQIAYLTREQVELFQSDFKVVADYFVQKRENGDYVPSSQDLTHVQETLQLLSIMTNDHRFEDAYNTSTDDRKGGPRNMCDVLDKVENRGIEKGIVKGESRGENKMALLVKKLLDQNRIDDVKRASEDEKSRAELMKELGINRTKKKKALGFCNGGQELFCILFCKQKEVPIIEKKAHIGRIRWWIYEWFKVKR